MFEVLVADAEVAAAGLVRRDAALSLTDEQLMAGVVDLERARTLLDSAEGALLAELDKRGATDRITGLRTAGWVSKTCGGPRSKATSRINVARKLRDTLHDTQAALAEATITFDHARVLSDAANPRIAEQFAGPVERALLDLAQHATFRRWCDEVRRVANQLDLDGGHDPDLDVDSNRLTLSPMLDGAVDVSGRLVGLGAESVRQAVDRVADELAERYRRDAEVTDGETQVPRRPVLRALALIELVRRANAAGDPGVVGPSPEITLTIDADHIGPDGTPTEASSPDGTPLPANVIRGLGCDLALHPVILDSLGLPLDLGRTVRTATPHQRRALAARDGGCVFPGCDAPPSRCHSHHVDHWIAQLGNTDVRRMVSLCPHHHGVIHRSGWRLDLDDQQWAVITTPAGVTLHGQRHRTTRAGPAPPRAA